MLSSSLDTLLNLSKTTYPQKLFANDCVTLYNIFLGSGTTLSSREIQGSSGCLPDRTDIPSIPGAERHNHMAPRPGFRGFVFLKHIYVILYNTYNWFISLDFIEFQSYIRQTSWGTLSVYTFANDSQPSWFFKFFCW